MPKFKELYQHYRKYAPINQADWEDLENLMTPRSLAKGERLISPGEMCHSYGIVLTGLFKLYYIGDEGREYIKVFKKEGDLLAPYAEMLQNIPSRTFIEAMEDSEILTIEARSLDDLTGANPDWKVLRGAITEKLFIEKERKEFDLLQLSAAERYESFLKNHKEVAQRISQYHIASYLGITPVALSRIVKRRN